MKTQIKTNGTIIFLYLAVFWGQALAQTNGTSKNINFNRDWRFIKGEQSDQVTQLSFDDSGWQPVRLPHDWAISGPFDPESEGSSGKLPWKGVGWYRKVFDLGAYDKGMRVYFDFDGIMAFPKVYVNGELAGEWDYGYNSFRIEATPYVKFSGKNVIAVLVDTRNHGTRWYPGAGIYRKVTMTISNPIHTGHWSTVITTPEVSDKSAVIQIQSTIENHLAEEALIEAEIVLYSPGGNEVAHQQKKAHVTGNKTGDIDMRFEIKNPQRWDITDPKLYKAKVSLRRDNKIVDTEEVKFGIRTFKFTADDGFHLNGRRVQLFGVNLHHDLGPLGSAFNRRAMQRQLEIMQDMGCNALRTSHNAPAPEVLELCDEMGILVWDELFDKWDHRADRVNGKPPLEEYGKKQVRNFVRRDRNHPCIVVWSIGNEISNRPWDPEGKSPERVKFMADYFRRYDPTRPVGLACHIPGTVDQPMLDHLDLSGWNYARRYARARQVYPEKPIIYSESASALSTRGFYKLPLPDAKIEYAEEEHQVSSYDHNAAPWSDIPDAEFDLMARDTFVAGEMVWTGFDYLGEPTPFTQEARSSYFGIVDLCGIPKDRFYLYRSHWRPEETTVHILPHWNWPDRVGKEVPVYVYTNGDEAELFLNGKSLGRRSKTNGQLKNVNLAKGKAATASSADSSNGYVPSCGNDNTFLTRWSAGRGDDNPWWQVDLASVQAFSFLNIELERSNRIYKYRIQTSTDGTEWKNLILKENDTGESSRVTYNVDAHARYLRMAFDSTGRRLRPAIREFGIYREKVDESPYYAVLDKYRLRWMEVIYEPGELKAVAYKNGRNIGEQVIRTAGKPSQIRLSPDRTKLASDGEDLSFVLVEALDQKGIPCPLADNLITFETEGPAEIAGVGNGNPLSLEPFQANYRRLFYGKAMLIVRAQEGKSGKIIVTAKSPGLSEEQVTLWCE